MRIMNNEYILSHKLIFIIIIFSAVQCQEDYFRCPEGTCIPELYVCDEYPGDCLNNYDDSEELCCSKLFI